MENNHHPHNQDQEYLLHQLHQWPPPVQQQQESYLHHQNELFYYNYQVQVQQQQQQLQLQQEKPKNLLDCMPCGYRFCPTDEELILHYLRKKLAKSPLPLNRIHEANVYASSPQELTRNYPQDRYYNVNGWYFFTQLTNKYPNGSRPSRSCATGGFWKPTGKDKEIRYQGNVIGYRKSLDFSLGSPPGVKTAWKMHEYRIGARSPKSDPVLCKLYLNIKRKRGDENRGDKEEMSSENLDQGSTVNEAPQHDLVVSNLPSAGSSTTEDIPTPNAASSSAGGASSNHVFWDRPNFVSNDQIFRDFHGYVHSLGGYHSTDQTTYGSTEQLQISTSVAMFPSDLYMPVDQHHHLDTNSSNLTWKNYYPNGSVPAPVDDFPKPLGKS